MLTLSYLLFSVVDKCLLSGGTAVCFHENQMHECWSFDCLLVATCLYRLFDQAAVVMPLCLYFYDPTVIGEDQH